VDVVGRLGLTLNEKKTSIPNARQERFDFLGYSFGPHYSRRTGQKQMGCSPSKKSMNRIRVRVSEHLRPANTAPWEEVRDRSNQKLRGWKEYFRLGNPWKAYRVLDEHVEERVRHFLRRRHKVSSQGTSQFSRKTYSGSWECSGCRAGSVTPVRESGLMSGVGRRDGGIFVSTRAQPRLYPAPSFRPTRFTRHSRRFTGRPPQEVFGIRRFRLSESARKAERANVF
jgi:hypothetical protein